MPSMWIIVPVAVLVLIGALAWAWDYKWRPRQMSRGIPCPSFSRNVSLIFQSIIGDAPTKDSGSEDDKKRLVVDWRIVHAVDAVIIAGAVYLWASGTLDWSWKVFVPLILVPLSLSMGRINMVKSKTLKLVNDVFSVANPKLFYLRADKTANLHPWDFVNVQKLTDDGQVHTVSLVLPATFSVSSIEARTTFEREFSALMSSASDADWKFDWKPENRRLIAHRVPPLPTSVTYPGSGDKPWNVIPLGVSNDGEECWDLSKTPQGVILGLTGSGKSVTQRSILYHAFQHPNDIRMYGIDLKRVELTMWEKYPGMIQVAVDVESALEVITNAEDVMMDRFTRMQAGGVNHIDKLGNEPAILIMFDESAQALMLGNGKSPEAKEENSMKAIIGDKVKSIARLGRAAKVHLILCTQRAQVDAIGGGDAKNNYGFRIMLGHGDKVASMMALDTMTGTETPPGVKGRGVISRDGAEVKFQSYWTPEDWPEKHGIYPVGKEPSTTATPSFITDDMDAEYAPDSDGDVQVRSAAEEQAQKSEAPSVFHSILEDTDDGMIELLDDDDDGHVADDEYGFTPSAFGDVVSADPASTGTVSFEDEEVVRLDDLSMDDDMFGDDDSLAVGNKSGDNEEFEKALKNANFGWK